jgi:hypothetical protein
MQNEDAPAAGRLESLITRRLADAPPPMPTAKPLTPPPSQPSAQPVQPDQAGAAGGWGVDADNLARFTATIDMVRDQLDAVRRHVERMRSASFTPKLGISPVAEQLEQKFTDRLDTPLDNREQPTSGGLRPMLVEAMGRMEQFVAGAEAAVRAYLEHDQTAAERMNKAGKDG